MKNTQLKRLNKVLHNGVIKTVDCISPGYITFIENREDETIFGNWISLDDIDFIELTDEILVDSGFTLYKSGAATYMGAWFVLKKFEGKYHYSGDSSTKMSVEIKHLHQLQNIVFFLIGKEI